MLPILIVLLPLVGALLTFTNRHHVNRRNMVAIVTTVATWILALMLIPGLRDGAIELRLENFLVIGLSFRIDYLSILFLVLFTTVWMLATIYGTVYMSFEHAQTRFFIFLLITYTGVLGVVAAGDFFTLFLFFELMTFCSYVLVIHEEDPDAMRAGNLYLFLGVIGGLALLLAIILYYNQTGTMGFESVLLAFEGKPVLLLSILVLFTIGFGLKAGMAPLHIWLPKAHPIAPSPASALLSGIMIKTGAYGLIRVFASAFGYVSDNTELYSKFISSFGYWIIWAGLITMFIGAFLALFQTSSKKILAYSSVSQIGYIIMGIGSATYLGSYGAMAMSGAIYHIINHALFKGALFLVVGAIYIHTHELDINKIRGLSKKYKFLMLIFIISALGITGVPGFNAYPSKSLLHHAVTDAYKYNHLVSLIWAERVFTLTSALTVCYFAKLFKGLFLGELPEKYKDLPDTPLLMKMVLTVFGAIMIFIGFFPDAPLKGVVIPAISTLGYNDYSVGYVEKFTAWNRVDLMAIVITFALAAVIFTIVEKFNLYRIQFPKWMSVEYLIFNPLAKGFMFLCLGPSVVLDRTVNKMYHGTGQVSMDVFKHIGDVEKSIDKAYTNAGSITTSMCQGLEHFEETVNKIYESAGTANDKLCQGIDKAESTYNDSLDSLASVHDKVAQLKEKGELKAVRMFDLMVKHEGNTANLTDAKIDCKKGHCPFAPDKRCVKISKEKSFWEKMAVSPEWNLRNINFDALIVATLFTIVLLILVFFSKGIL
ncbi:NADH dehydrogenase subunit [Alkalicella caledoniensis]|uniref:NADH dehydrogenase subunit n=1 Tax=Alkalicella caledoniensis TaxID=2731377 RepID=A0A7G9W4K6_ALKCA|nr:proton-conducting transporter membrane subunit [Alkalicella caledoniensis]QNO13618.1 NADH dehydrogenase subunit [Alkalicella caledoniensis]